MLDELVTELIVWKNLKKIAPAGSLSSLFQDDSDKPNLILLGSEDRSLGYYLRFLCTSQGIIKYCGHPDYFPKKVDQYYEGIFVVALDSRLVKLAKSGRAHESIREEKFVDIIYTNPNVPEKTKKRIEYTMGTFNQRFGFSDHILFIGDGAE